MGLIDYIIENQKDYQGRLKNISQKKDGNYQSPVPQKQIQFTIRFFKPSPVSKISIISYHTQIFILSFFNTSFKQIHSEKIEFSYDKKDTLERPCNIQQFVDKVKVTLRAKDQPKKMGLNLLLFRSANDSTYSDQKSKINNLSKNQQFEKSPHQIITGTRNRQIFDNRKKSDKHQSIARQLNMLEMGYKASTRSQHNKEQLQIKKAIDLSLKQAGKKKQQPIQIQDDQMRKIHPSESNLPLVQYTSQQMEAFKYVSSKWLQAQRNMQSIHRVPEQNRLSNQIKVRIFHKKNVCMDVYGQKGSKLKRTLQILGAKIIDQPLDDCWVICQKKQSDKINKAKKKKNVKFLRPQYIQDCFSSEAKLDQKQYILNL